MTQIRECVQCSRRKPMNDYRLQGRGRMKTCRECEGTPHEPSWEEKMYRGIIETNSLLRSPRCAKCGAHGASDGNPPLCERHEL